MSVRLGSTGVLQIDGKQVFPICLSNPPPYAKKAPSGKKALAEVAEAGVTLIRSGLETWSIAAFDAQIAEQWAILDAAAAAGIRCWFWLGNAASHPTDPHADEVQLIPTESGLDQVHRVADLLV